MAYKIILLDADGTLFDFEKAEIIAFKNMLTDFGVSYSEWLFSIYLRENKQVWQELEKGIISQEKLKTERFKRFLETSKITGDEKQYAASYMAHLANASILFDDALDVVKKLSENHTLIIVTNGLKEVQHKRIRESILKPYIKKVIISDEFGKAKPDPSIIYHALEGESYDDLKQDVVIIGDSLTSDIKGGINAGISTVWYNPNHLKNKSDIIPDFEISNFNELT
jgi:putative hydrolase of the HAD superfamily